MQKIHPQTDHWIESKLDKETMDYLWSQIKMAKENHKDKLVGHLASSLTLPDTKGKLNDCVVNLSKNLYNGYFTPQFEQGILSVKHLWVNFQKKYDFNPIHNHTGTLSFVIWMKIPYTQEDEANTARTKGVAEGCLSGCFTFLFTGMLGQIIKHNYHLNPSYDGTILIFPSQMNHAVYPFYTSDEERISISGNIL
tara:strand:- start:46 stop:630 length:585 start_codon:yes stop_codon:yes gene_type:complete